MSIKNCFLIAFLATLATLSLFVLLYASYSQKYQEYKLDNMTGETFVLKVKELAENDSSLNPNNTRNNQTITPMYIASNSEYNNIWKMNIYLPEINRIIKFSILADDNICSLDNFTLASNPLKWTDLYTDSVPLKESYNIEKAFETTILNKIGSYQKDNFKLIYFFYNDYFILKNTILIALMLLLIIYLSNYYIKSRKSFKEYFVLISLILYTSSLPLPCIKLAEYSIIAIDNYVLSIAALSFGWLGILDNGLSGWIWVANVFYIFSVYCFLKNKRIKWATICLAVALSITFLLCDHISANNGKKILISAYDVGYYLWLASFVVLFVGMLITNLLDKKTKLKE